MSRPTHALVLTAGLGTRLAPLTSVRAKPAIPVAGEPMIRRIIRWLVQQNVRDITLNLHHLPETITSVVGDGTDLGGTVRYSWEQPAILGSAGGPRLALDIIGADTFFLVNGDTLTDATLESLWQAHRASDAAITMALTPNTAPLRYGGVKIDAEGRVRGFVPKGSAATGSGHFIGVQVVSRRAFSKLVAGRPANTVGGLYDELIVERPGSVRGHYVNGRFWDIGTIADYRRTSLAFSSDAADFGDRPHVAGTASISRSILWNRIRVGDRAILDDCIVTDDVDVPQAAEYRHRILMRSPEGQLRSLPFEVS